MNLECREMEKQKEMNGDVLDLESDCPLLVSHVLIYLIEIENLDLNF